jgi:hypothetical protein
MDMGQWHEESSMRYTIHKKTPHVRLSLTWNTIIYKTYFYLRLCMHVHYRLELNMKKIIDSFARKHPKRMMLNDIINDSLN